MNNQDVEIKGLIRDYPDFKYTTKELIDSLGNKLSEEVKKNIFQLGVESRFFVRPFEQFLSNSSEKIHSLDDDEPISELCTKVGKPKTPFCAT